MNKAIETALQIIENEYFKIKSSTEKYKMREEILERIEEMKIRSIEQQNKKDNITKDSVLNAFITIIEDIGYSEFEFNITENMSVLEIKNKYDLDGWDWADILSSVSTTFDIFIDDVYQSDNTVLKDIIEQILKDN